MVSKLSISNLLGQLEVDRAGDLANLRQLCEGVRRALQYKNHGLAIQMADAAVEVSRRAYNNNLYAVALLHRSAACLYSNLRRETQQSIRDCELALDKSSHNLHNLAIARIIRAQIDVYIQAWNDALVHFEQAVRAVDDLIASWKQRGGKNEIVIYEDLKSEVQGSVKRLVDSLIDIEQFEKGPSIDLPPVTRVVWPSSDSQGPLSLPLHTPFILDSPALAGQVSPGSPTSDFVETDRFLLKGKHYTLRPIDASSEAGTARLQYGQQYIATKVEIDEEPAILDEEYILVRMQSQTPVGGEKLVIDNTPIESSGPRRWTIRDGSEKELYTRRDLRIIGVAEAVFTPTKTIEERLSDFERLLSEFQSRGMDPEIISGLTTIRDMLQERLYEHSRQSKVSSRKSRPRTPKPTIGVVTALPKEYTAVDVLFPRSTQCVVRGRGSGRRYEIAEIDSVDGGKHVVALLLGDMGTNSAGTRVTQLLLRFHTVNWIIMVGIAGGVPFPEWPDEHVRLGDVVVSSQVIQVDYIKRVWTKIIPRHASRPPSSVLVEGVRHLQAEEIAQRRPWLKYLEDGMQQLHVTRPPEEEDILVSSKKPYARIDHPRDKKRISGQPRIFLGPIASSNTLLKDAKTRDEWRTRFGVKAIEMEGAGVADATWNAEVQYLVIRGICDYCDVNKADTWQEYAAVAAAAYTRALLESIPSEILSS